MFEGSDRIDTSELGVDGVGRTHVGKTDWKTIDARLRVLARRRAALDAEELALIRAAQRLELHRRVGMGSLREYLERVLGTRRAWPASGCASPRRWSRCRPCAAR